MALLVALIVGAPDPGGPSQFSAGVHVVELNVAVVAGRKHVEGLDAADFEVRDNGIAQPIASLTRDLHPIDLAVAVDMSETQGRHLLPPIARAIGRIKDHLRPIDRVSILTFGSRIRTVVPLVAVDGFTVAELGVPSEWGTHGVLYDVLGVMLAAPVAPDRRQLIVAFADGGDGGSFLSENHVLDLAARSGTAVFTVTRTAGSSWQGASFPRAINEHPSRTPTAFFERLAAITGGQAKTAEVGIVERPAANALTVSLNSSLLDNAFTNAIDEFRSSYTLRYTLSGQTSGWHDVAVSVRGHSDYVVRTRSGYRID
jgi:hypothetical protein